MATVFQSVSRLSSGRFKFFSCSSCSCARFFSLDTNRIAGTTSPEPEHPPDGTVFVARSLGYLPESRDVSTVLLNTP